MSDDEWHSNRLAFLREKRVKIAAMPDTLGISALPCPMCGTPMNVSLGQRSKVWFIAHPKDRCALSDDLWRVEAATRELAIQRWKADNGA